MIFTDEQRWQQHLARRPQVVRLVRGLLGCTCPETVFDHYQIRRHVVTSLPVLELIMGDRLLVWMVDSARIDEPGSTFAHLLNAGFSERERRGLNRFRLVVVGDVAEWETQWGHLTEKLDPKVHLHVLPAIG